MNNTDFRLKKEFDDSKPEKKGTKSFRKSQITALTAVSGYTFSHFVYMRKDYLQANFIAARPLRLCDLSIVNVLTYFM